MCLYNAYLFFENMLNFKSVIFVTQSDQIGSHRWRYHYCEQTNTAQIMSRKDNAVLSAHGSWVKG